MLDLDFAQQQAGGAQVDLGGLQWAHPPSRPAYREDGALVLHADGETDYWQRTHYGFRVHNGHFLRLPDVRGDFILTTTVSTQPRQRFDQAGLMVELSPSCWLKTSCEFGEPSSQLGVVVTNAGYSDWSTLELPNAFRTVALRVRRQGSDYTVEACVPRDSLQGPAAASCPIKVGSGKPDSPVSEWSQLRVCHLLEDVAPPACGRNGEANEVAAQLEACEGLLPASGVAAGLYACSPKPGGGFDAAFSRLSIVRGRLPGVE